MIRTLIIEDERLAASELQGLLQYVHGVQVVGVADNVQDSIRAIEQYKPDLLLLDLFLHQGSGFDVLQAFPEQTFDTIVITGHPIFELASQCFQYGITDYLLKPISSVKLQQALERVVAKRPHKQQHGKILVHDRSGVLRVITTDEIIYSKAMGKYSLIQCLDTQITVLESISKLEELLPSHNFFRIHRSCIVHLKHVKSITCDGRIVLAHGDTERLVLAVRRRTDFAERFTQYCQ